MAFFPFVLNAVFTIFNRTKIQNDCAS